ncbi:MAG: cell division FtsA domain-containing protein, partial [Candidatus Marinamargulisbacteria bacterium]
CSLTSSNKMTVLATSTSVLKGVRMGRITDPVRFVDALQNCLRRAQAMTSEVIQDICINIPNAHARYVIQTGIVQSQFEGRSYQQDCERAMRKAVECIDKKHQSVLHLFPINQRMDGEQKNTDTYYNIEVDTGIVFGDTHNLDIVLSSVKALGLTIKGVISDYLAMSTFGDTDTMSRPQLIIDIGRQITSFCVVLNGQLTLAKTHMKGAEHITLAIADEFSCSYSEAERLKVLHGTLSIPNAPISSSIQVQTNLGPQLIEASLLRAVIESQVAQLFKYIQMDIPGWDQLDCIQLLGGGSQLLGLSDWLNHHQSVPVIMQKNIKYSHLFVNSNYFISMGQLIYGYKIGLIQAREPSLIKKWILRVFKN